MSAQVFWLAAKTDSPGRLTLARGQRQETPRVFNALERVLSDPVNLATCLISFNVTSLRPLACFSNFRRTLSMHCSFFADMVFLRPLHSFLPLQCVLPFMARLMLLMVGQLSPFRARRPAKRLWICMGVLPAAAICCTVSNSAGHKCFVIHLTMMLRRSKLPSKRTEQRPVRREGCRLAYKSGLTSECLL